MEKGLKDKLNNFREVRKSMVMAGNCFPESE